MRRLIIFIISISNCNTLMKRTMGRFQMVMLTKAVDGRVEELATWHDNRHIPELKRVPGFVSGRRSRSIGTICRAALRSTVR